MSKSRDFPSFGLRAVIFIVWGAIVSYFLVSMLKNVSFISSTKIFPSFTGVTI